jgi:hypothetical protein
MNLAADQVVSEGSDRYPAELDGIKSRGSKTWLMNKLHLPDRI